MGKIKQERTSGQIRKILSQLILREVADPRLQGITITDVELDPELLYAKVYVNALGEEEREAEVLFALDRAKGYLRREVAKRVHLRKAPELLFRWDHTLERIERINDLISKLDIPPEESALSTEIEADDDSEPEYDENIDFEVETDDDDSELE